MGQRESSLGEWLMSKILTYLKSKEGFSTPFGVDEQDMTKVLVQDAMGFRYEVIVRNIGRSPIYSFDEKVELKQGFIDKTK